MCFFLLIRISFGTGGGLGEKLSIPLLFLVFKETDFQDNLKCSYVTKFLLKYYFPCTNIVRIFQHFLKIFCSESQKLLNCFWGEDVEKKWGVLF